MKIVEVLKESNDLVSKEFNSLLQDRGYQAIARGSKLFYKSPKSNKILVIVNPIANKEFTDWVNFCNQNVNNPHLPKYTKLKILNFQNPSTGKIEKYTSVFTEELRNNSRGLAIEAIETWGSIVLGNPRVVFGAALEEFLGYKEEDGYDKEEILNKLYSQIGGYQEGAVLFNTIKKTVLAGQQLGYDNDLYDDNIMINSRGMFVINDPWVNF